MQRVIPVWLWPVIFATFVLGAPPRGYAQTIKGIEIRGNQRVSKEAILEQITSREGESYDSFRVNTDVQAIYDMGCFGAVSSIIERTPNPEEAILVFGVQERPKLIALSWKGMNVLRPTDPRVLAAGRVHLGFIENATELHETINGVVQLYHQLGYPHARVTYRAEMYPHNTVVGEFDVTEGQHESNRRSQ